MVFICSRCFDASILIVMLNCCFFSRVASASGSIIAKNERRRSVHTAGIAAFGSTWQGGSRLNNRCTQQQSKSSSLLCYERKYQQHQQLLSFMHPVALESRGWYATQNVPVVRTSTTLRSITDGNNKLTEPTKTLAMDNLCHAYTVEDDALLWENRNQDTFELAALMGRGLRGVEQRLKKLKDVNSKAYERLFVCSNGSHNKQSGDDDDDSSNRDKKKILIPASELLRRLQWDYALPSKDFSFLYYDRVDDAIIESAVDAPNKSISGAEEWFVHALPEHRIVAFKYKERIVWDRRDNLKTDLFFSSPGIAAIVSGYDEWKEKKDATEQWNKQRQSMVAKKLKGILGVQQFNQLKVMASDLQEQSQSSTITKKQAKQFVFSVLELFQVVRDDPSCSLVDPSLIPATDYYALDSLSELVALLPEEELRSNLLSVLAENMKRLDGKTTTGDERVVDVIMTQNNSKKKKSNNYDALPELDEDDLDESYARGSGAGGQKVNKTSNKVVLVHKPTSIRVDCQDTRSLQQNRKIARKRLRLKLDDFINGNNSRNGVKAQQKSSKKAKAKARSRARLAAKKEKKINNRNQ